MQELFGECIVGSDIWPPRSPDVTASHFFLYGFVRGRVYSNNPRSLKELKHNIEQTVASNDPETLRKVTRNTSERMDASLREDGDHF